MATEMLRLRRKQRLGLARFRVLYGKKYRTDRACTEAFSLSKAGKRIDKKLDEFEVKKEVLDSVIDGYEMIVKAASREMSRRDSERTPKA